MKAAVNHPHFNSAITYACKRRRYCCTTSQTTLLSIPNKHIREAIEYAEVHGWTFTKAGGRARV
jgi:hypothetical protein